MFVAIARYVNKKLYVENASVLFFGHGTTEEEAVMMAVRYIERLGSSHKIEIIAGQMTYMITPIKPTVEYVRSPLRD